MTRSTSVLLPIIAFIAMGGVWFVTFKLIEQDKADLVNEVELTTKHVAGLYKEQVVRSLRDIDLTLSVVRHAAERHGLKGALPEVEGDLLVPASLVFSIDIVDQAGHVAASNHASHAPDVLTQPYFRHFASPAASLVGDTIYIDTSPSQSDASKREMHFARRISDAKGQFAGVVLVSIDPAYFTTGYDPSRVGQQGVLGMVDVNGRIVVTRTGDRIGGMTADAHDAARINMPTTSTEDSITATLTTNPWDGVKRYTAITRLNAFPLGIIVGLSESEQLNRLQENKLSRQKQAAITSAMLCGMALLVWQLGRSRARIRRAQTTYYAASEASQDACFVLHSVCDVSGATVDFMLIDINGRALSLTGRDKTAVLDKPLSTLLPTEVGQSIRAILSSVMETGETYSAEQANEWPAIPAKWLHVQAMLAGDAVVVIVRDISVSKEAQAELLRRNEALTHLNSQLHEAHEHLIQSEKLASIGLLAAGVAHEINNPVGFVMSNIGTLDGYIKKLFELIDAYQASQVEANNLILISKMSALCEKMDLAYLREDIPSLMRETKDGIDRVRRIVRDLKNFSHVDSSHEWQLADLHAGIDSTLNVVSNEVKYKADVVKAYGDIPPIFCLPSELNQVIMNLVVNAAHAMGDERGTITITTGHTEGAVWVDIADNGSGIAPANLAHIFDPFFTTKPVGKGTGLGLSLAYGIVKKHGGQLTVTSELGVGTTFRMTLPIKPPTAT